MVISASEKVDLLVGENGKIQPLLPLNRLVRLNLSS